MFSLLVQTWEWLSPWTVKWLLLVFKDKEASMWYSGTSCCRTTFIPFEMISFVNISTSLLWVDFPLFVLLGFLFLPAYLLQYLKRLLDSHLFPLPSSSSIFFLYPMRPCILLLWSGITFGHVSMLKISYALKSEKGCLLIIFFSPWLFQ